MAKDSILIIAKKTGNISIIPNVLLNNEINEGITRIVFIIGIILDAIIPFLIDKINPKIKRPVITIMYTIIIAIIAIVGLLSVTGISNSSFFILCISKNLAL